MTTEQGYLEEVYGTFCKNLHSALKKRINASIYVNVDEDDTLNICINKGRMGWRGMIPNVMTKLASGYSTDSIVNYIISQYKKSVLNAYFY